MEWCPSKSTLEEIRENLEKKEKVCFSDGRRTYDANQIFNEVKRGTDFGRRVYELHIRLGEKLYERQRIAV